MPLVGLPVGMVALAVVVGPQVEDEDVVEPEHLEPARTENWVESSFHD